MNGKTKKIILMKTILIFIRKNCLYGKKDKIIILFLNKFIYFYCRKTSFTGLMQISTFCELYKANPKIFIESVHPTLNAYLKLKNICF